MLFVLRASAGMFVAFAEYPIFLGASPQTDKCSNPCYLPLVFQLEAKGSTRSPHFWKQGMLILQGALTLTGIGKVSVGTA